MLIAGPRQASRTFIAALLSMAPVDAAGDLDAQLEPHKQRMIKHMNDDHRDSLVAYALHYAKMSGASDAEISDMTSKGLTLNVTLPDSVARDVFIPYSRPLTAVKDVRPVVVDMHKECYDALGCMYKLKSGFYKKKVEAAVAGAKKSPKMQQAFVLGAASAVVVAFVFYRRRHSA